MIKDLDLNIRIDKTLKVDYKEFCKKNNYVLAKRLRALMVLDMEGKINNINNDIKRKNTSKNKC
jgi:hypothetical protein